MISSHGLPVIAGVKLNNIPIQKTAFKSKSQNPFAYYTAAITNSFTRILNIEKKNQNIRDDILEMNGLNPSWTRQNSGKAGMAAMSGPVTSSLDE